MTSSSPPASHLAAHDHPLALIGPMGAGKSSVGRVLARLLDRPFVDLDQQIETRAGASVSLIFEVDGETGFRQREHEMLIEELAHPRVVLACGGGVILDPRNRAALKARAVVIHLQASVDEQLQRLARDRSRPLLQTDDRRAKLETLAHERSSLYQEVADLSWHATGQRPAVVARQIAEHLAQLQSNHNHSSQSP